MKTLEQLTGQTYSAGFIADALLGKISDKEYSESFYHYKNRFDNAYKILKAGKVKARSIQELGQLRNALNELKQRSRNTEDRFYQRLEKDSELKTQFNNFAYQLEDCLNRSYKKYADQIKAIQEKRNKKLFNRVKRKISNSFYRFTNLFHPVPRWATATVLGSGLVIGASAGNAITQAVIENYTDKDVPQQQEELLAYDLSL